MRRVAVHAAAIKERDQKSPVKERGGNPIARAFRPMGVLIRFRLRDLPVDGVLIVVLAVVARADAGTGVLLSAQFVDLALQLADLLL